jgi:hypothetical protein
MQPGVDLRDQVADRVVVEHAALAQRIDGLSAAVEDIVFVAPGLIAISTIDQGFAAQVAIAVVALAGGTQRRADRDRSGETLGSESPRSRLRFLKSRMREIG